MAVQHEVCPPDGEPINSALRAHALDVEGWRLGPLVRELHRWVDIFDEELQLGLETPALEIDKMRIRTAGTYRRGRNGHGLLHDVTLNERHLDQGMAETLDTLLHELIHLWQELHGKPGKGNYHNAEFRSKALSFGLHIDQWDHSLGVGLGPFRDLLKKYGVDESVLPVPQSEPIRRHQPGTSKLRKFSCKCTNVRSYKDLHARCLQCGQLFEEAAPSW